MWSSVIQYETVSMKKKKNDGVEFLYARKTTKKREFVIHFDDMFSLD